VPGGRIAIYVGSASVGQGLETVLTQIAADALGLPADRIDIYHGSTTYLAEGVGSGYSRSTVMGGSVIVEGADALKAKIAAAAARHWDCDPNSVSVEPGLSVVAGNQRLTREEIGDWGLSCDVEFSNDRVTYAYGAAAAHVAVDPATGHVTVLDYVTVEDVGRIINPVTVKGQAVGAAVQGLGGALLEQIVYDDAGQLLTATFADYMLPVAGTAPSVRAEALEMYPALNNRLGAKGAGEGGTVPVGGVIANAVAAALAPLGIEPRELPLSPQKVWRLLQASKRRA
jgi:carbon-monoxide dehydrogenase large subunit